MGACSKTSKVFLVLLGLIIWAAAGALIFIASDIFTTYRHYEEISSALYTLIPASIIIGVAVLLFIIGLIGCVGAFKEHKCLLATFFIFLLIVFVAEVAAGITGYVYREDVEDALQDGISDGLTHYGDGNYTTLSHEIDYMQGKLTCCGVHSYADWLTTDWYTNHTMSLPSSCCRQTPSESDNTTCALHYNGTELVPSDEGYTKGCYNALVDIFTSNLVTIAAVSITFAVIQVAGMICSCVLMHRSREVPYLTLTSMGGGYRA